MKNHANMAAAQSTPTPFAVETLRSRNRPSGMSGELMRDSMKTNVGSRTTAAAEHHADRAAAGGDEAEDSHRLGALGGLGEQGHHQRQGYRRGDRAAEALDRTRRHEQSLRVREATGERGEGEERDAREKQPAM